MSLLGAMNNSSLAMLGQSIAMGQISTNIANVNTTGYKHDTVNFRTLLSGTSSTQFRSFSAQAVSDRHVAEQGVVHTTGRSLDVAVNGNGMFAVNRSPDGSGGTYYTRDGSFQKRIVNENGAQTSYLATGAGYYVMGWPATIGVGGAATFNSTLAPTPVRFAPEDRISGQPTTQVSIVGNVNAELNEQKVPLSIVGEEVQSTDENGVTTATWPTLGVNLLFSRTSSTGLSDPSDSANTWFVSLRGADGSLLGQVNGADEMRVVFGSDAKLIEPENGRFDVVVTGNENVADQAVSIDAYDITQYGDKHGQYVADAAVGRSDGYMEGLLQDVSINEQGVLYGSYSNNRNLPLYKLAIAQFPAPQLLKMESENLYSVTPEAGARRLVQLGTPDGGRTAIAPGALEASTVDIADQFSRMIMTQTAYSQASTVFRTTDEMTTVASGLKR